MTLQTTGNISMGEIQTEFGNGNPIILSDYYRGGDLVASTDVVTEGPYYNPSPAYFVYYYSLYFYYYWNSASIGSTYYTIYSLYSGGYTYYVSTLYSGSYYYIYRTGSTAINTSVPSSGEISLTDFYGAYAP